MEHDPTKYKHLLDAAIRDLQVLDNPLRKFVVSNLFKDAIRKRPSINIGDLIDEIARLRKGNS